MQIFKKASAINLANNISTINFKIILNLINRKKIKKLLIKWGKIVFKEIISQLKTFMLSNKIIIGSANVDSNYGIKKLY